MSEHYYRVGVHGPPDPDDHPWVMAKFDGGQWRLVHVAAAPGRRWADDELWFPVDAPPSELAPVEDEGVEVDGETYRLDGDRIEIAVPKIRNPRGWVHTDWRSYTTNDFRKAARVAQALGLVPAVPASLVDWLRNVEHGAAPGSYGDGRRSLAGQMLRRIEAGEFGPVEGVDR